MRPIICFDFDGTLVNKTGHIHPRDVAFLASEKAVHFVPATGRPLHAVQHAFHQNGLFLDRPIPFPMVLQNGAVLYQSDEALLFAKTFQVEINRFLLKRVQQYTQISCLGFGPDQVYILSPNEAGLKMVARFALRTQPLTPDKMDWQYTKFAFVAQTPEPLQKFARQTENLPVERFFSLPTVFEMTPPGVDKGSGLVLLLNKLGWSKNQIVAVGDGENDLPLFEQARISFCPHDCPAHIRALADHVIDITKNGLFDPLLAELALE